MGGMDDDTVAGILEALEGAPDKASPDIAAFVFIVKNGGSWSGSFLDSAKRYWDQFPDFRDNWIFVHTCMDAFEENYSQGLGTCFEECAAIRKRDLVDSLIDKVGDTGRILESIPHVFVENIGVMDHKKLAKYSKLAKKAQFQWMERAKAFNQLTKLICSRPMKETVKMEYRKSEDINNLDGHMMTLFSYLFENTKGFLEEEEKQNTVPPGWTSLHAEKQTVNAEIEIINARLENLDTREPIVKVRRTCHEEWSFFGGWSKQYSIQVPYRYGVTKDYTANLGYKDSMLQTVSFEFDPEKKAKVWTVNCESSWLRGFDSEIQLSVESKRVHEPEINTLEEKLEKAEKNHRNIKEKLEKAEKNHKAIIEERVRIKREEMALYAECRLLSSRTSVDVQEWKKLSPFYKWAQSYEGRAALKVAITDPGQMDQFMEKFCEAHGDDLLNRYRDIVKQTSK